MKRLTAVQCAVSVLLAVTACSAMAQGSDASAAEAAASAVTTAPSAKTKRAANRQLQKKIRQALLHTKGLSASGISVRARDGAVTLQGWVPDQSQVALATGAVKGVAGVTSVSSELIVRPIGQ